MGYIYKITCNVKGKQGVYIGQTVRTVQQRWKQHINQARYGKCYIGRMINKYGVNNFTVQTICQLQDKKQLDAKEKELIAYYRKTGKCYNISLGGEGTIPTEELRRYWQQTSYRNKSVICQETGIQYFSASEAARQLKLSFHDILDCCRMKRVQVANLHFRFPAIERRLSLQYWGAPLNSDQEVIQQALSKLQISPSYKRSVIQLTTNQTFSTLRQAAQVFGIDQRAIYRMCQKKTAKINGTKLLFLYAQATQEEKKQLLSRVHQRRLANGKNVRVKNLITQKEYQNITIASQQTGQPRSKIGFHINNKVKHPLWIRLN